MIITILVILTILISVAGTIALKLSDGFRKIKYAVFYAFCYFFSTCGMTYILKFMPLNIFYAIWSGVGTLLVFLVSIIYFNETLTLEKTLYLSIIILGVIGIQI